MEMVATLGSRFKYVYKKAPSSLLDPLCSYTVLHLHICFIIFLTLLFLLLKDFKFG
jgi:hypothetical protein